MPERCQAVVSDRELNFARAMRHELQDWAALGQMKREYLSPLLAEGLRR